MRLLLDENLPRKLVRLFAPKIEATTVRQCGWTGMKNGELLRLAQEEYYAFLTLNRGIEHQQNLEDLDLAIVVIRARSNKLEDIAPLIADVKAMLQEAQPGFVVRVPEG